MKKETNMGLDIHTKYVEWANSLDSTGTDSTEAQGRIKDENTLFGINYLLALLVGLGDQTDEMKKWVFYGKEIKGVTKYPWMLESEKRVFQERLCTHESVRMLHAIQGLVTETAELAKAFHSYLLGDIVAIDTQNVTEETGDLFWYLALIAKAQGYGTFAPFLLSNKAKLTRRYGDKFSQDAALNRNVEEELKALDGALK